MINFTFFYVNLSFIEIGVIDMKRKKFMMKGLEVMLEPNRSKVKNIYRLLPLFNYFDPQTLMSWIDLRMMALDVGKRFLIRIELYSGLYLITYGILAAIYLFWYFGVLAVEFPKSLIVVGAFEIINFTFFLYSMFHIGAQINELGSQ